jgi:hypothetical protein
MKTADRTFWGPRARSERGLWATVAFLVGCGVVGCGATAKPKAVQQTTPVSSTAAPVASSTPTTTPVSRPATTVPPPVPAERLPQPAPPVRAVIGGLSTHGFETAFYAAATGVYLSDAKTYNSRGSVVSSDLLRIDPTTGAVQDRLVLSGAYGQALLVGGNLWVISGTEPSVGADRATLLAVDPSTLLVRHRLVLPTAPSDHYAPDAIAAAGGGLWVAGSSALYRVAPTTATVTTAVPVTGASRTTIGADSSGTVLVDGESSYGGIWRVQRRNTTTGALLAQTAATIGVTSPTIGGIITSGIWISDPGGSAGGVERLDLTTLHPIAGSEVNGSNGVAVTVTGNRLWVTQPAGATVRNYCADPSNGAIIARLRFAIGNNDIIIGFADGDVIYIDQLTAGVVDRAPVPTGCDQ